MKIDVTRTVLDYQGKPVQETPAEDSPILTYRSAFFAALNNFAPDEKPPNDTKAKCFELTQKIFTEKEVNLNVEERALILERVNKIFNSPLVCGRVKEILEEKK